MVFGQVARWLAARGGDHVVQSWLVLPLLQFGWECTCARWRACDDIVSDLGGKKYRHNNYQTTCGCIYILYSRDIEEAMNELKKSTKQKIRLYVKE